MKRFEGGYVRGGQRTLYMTRGDVVETLAYLKREGYDLQEMQREATQENKEFKEVKKSLRT